MSHYFIHQTNSNNCGFTTLKMLLAIIYRDHHFLLLKNNEYPSKMTMAQFVQLANKYGLTLQGVKITDLSNLQLLKTPFVTLINQNDNLHYVVVKKHPYNKNKRLIYDGGSQIFPIKINKLKDMVSPYFLIIDKVKRYKLSSDEYFNLQIKYRLLHLLIHIISLIILIAAFYFIEQSFPFYISLSLITIAALSQIVQRSLLLIAMTDYDRKIITINIKKDGTFYRDIIDLKGKYFKYPLLFINHLLITLFIASIHIVNDIYYLIPITIISLVIVFYRVTLAKSISKKINQIAQLEKTLLTNTNCSFEEQFHKINKLTYRMVNFDLITKIILIFFIATLTFLLMAVKGHVFINYFLFTSLSLIIYADNLDKLLQTKQHKLDIKDTINQIISR